MKIGFVTDSFSTLTGLASVAYSSVDAFREVQNEVIKQSPTQPFDIHRPSDVFYSFLASEDYFSTLLVNAILSFYEDNEEFGDYVDETFGTGFEDYISKEILPSIYRSLDANSTYGLGFEDILNKSLSSIFLNYEGIEDLSSRVARDIESDVIPSGDISLVTNIANNSPKTKLYQPPLEAIVNLPQTVDYDLDHNGVSYTKGYLSPQEYYSGVGYPGYDGITSIPASMSKSIKDGYVGYSTTAPLESILGLSGSDSVFDFNSSNIASAANSILSMLDITGGFNLTQGDRDWEAIDQFAAKLNKFTNVADQVRTLVDINKNSDINDGAPFSLSKTSSTY